MKFIISRVSQNSFARDPRGVPPPIDGAVLAEKVRIFGDMYEYVYTIEADSIEDLLRIAGIDHNGIVLSSCDPIVNSKTDLPKWQIIIYDDYLD